MQVICNHDACRVHLVDRGDLQVHLLVSQCKIEVITENDTFAARRVVESKIFA